MSIREKILSDIIIAMKNREATRLGVLRMVKAAMQKQEIEEQTILDHNSMITLLSKLCKQRHESADAFINGGRLELANKELEEISIIEAYLPSPIDEKSLIQIIENVITEIGASSPKDTGIVMKNVMAKLEGQNVDGKIVITLVKTRLSA